MPTKVCLISETWRYICILYNFMILTGWEISARPFANASENLAGRVQNRPGRAEFCIGYIKYYQCRKWPVAHSPNSTWFWLELVGNCCERLKIIMECTNIQFCERLGHGWQFHPLDYPFRGECQKILVSQPVLINGTGSWNPSLCMLWKTRTMCPAYSIQWNLYKATTKFCGLSK